MWNFNFKDEVKGSNKTDEYVGEMMTYRFEIEI